MGYNLDKWKNRISYRSDLTVNLTHLTRTVFDSDGKVVLNHLEVLKNILTEKRLRGSSTSSGFIVGSNKAVCFQEAPLYGVGQNVLHEQNFREDLGGKIRYLGAGISFPKIYLFNAGARPVIYEKTENAKQFLGKDEWYRIVNLDYSNPERIVDWTHEREWRIKGDFSFDLSRVTVILPNYNSYQNFIEIMDKKTLTKIKGIVTLNDVIY